jgi:hypothetical protein
MEIKLSKGEYAKGLNCKLDLWLYRNGTDADISKLSEVKKKRRINGKIVRNSIRRFYPTGVIARESYTNLDKSIISTQKAIDDGFTVLFKPVVLTKCGLYSSVDVLQKTSNSDEWDMIAVKDSLEVQSIHVDEIAFQRYVFEEAGYKIRKNILLYINKEYSSLEEELAIDKVFIELDLTQEAISKKQDVINNIEYLDEIIKSDKPNIKMGKQCKSDYGCKYHVHCFDELVSKIFDEAEKA